MEPSSFPAAIDSLVASISSTSLTITNFIRIVRSARADLAAVTRELADLCLVLELLRDEHVVPPQMHNRARAVLDSCGVIMDRIVSVVESSSPSRIAVSDAAAASPAGVRWSVRQKGEVVQLWIGLQTYREALALVDEVTNLKPWKGEEAPIGIAIDYQEIRQASRRILGEIAQLRDMGPQAEAATGDTNKALDMYLDDLTRYTATLSKELLQSQQTPRPAQRLRGESSASSNSRARSKFDPVTADDAARFAGPSSSSSTVGSLPRTDPESQRALESCGPWFPSNNLVVPYYSRESLARPNNYSFHMPRRPSPSPGPSNRQPQRAELPAPTIGRSDIRQTSNGHRYRESSSLGQTAHAAVAPAHAPVAPAAPAQAPTNAEQSRPHMSPRPVQRPFFQSGNLTLPPRRGRPSDQLPVSPPPASSEKWATSVYVPESPASVTSGHLSQRNSALSSDDTSFQTSSDYSSSWTMYRSSVSTAGTTSAVDSISGVPSPKLAPFRPSQQNKPNSRPESSYSTVSSITSSIKDRMPRFRSVRRAFNAPSDGSAASLNKRHSRTSSGSSTVDRTSTISSMNWPSVPAPNAPLPTPPGSSPGGTRPRNISALDSSNQRLDIVPADGFTDPKTPETLHLDISPSNTYLATQHINHSIKIWSITTGATESTINYRAKFQAGPRSRMYFIRSHSILSEAMTLVAISTSFGNTIEIWNWAKKKRIQSIDHAARWACVRGDIYQAGTRPLAAYRAETNHIDLFSASRDPNQKKIFTQSRRIDLNNSGLPFLPYFPDLTYSATGPTLIGAAGPRPRALPDQQQCLLMAWQIDGPENGTSDKPYRWVVPSQPELLGALPSSLTCYGSLAVSVWFPANYRHIVTAKGQWRRVPVAVEDLHVVVWDLATNQTRLFSIPQGPCCVSPDCRLIAYCDLARDRFVVRDVSSGTVMWEGGPEEWEERPTTAGGTNSPKQLTDLKKVNVLQFTDDGGMLFVGDKDGGIGIYEIKSRPTTGVAGTGTGDDDCGAFGGENGRPNGRFPLPNMREMVEDVESQAVAP